MPHSLFLVFDPLGPCPTVSRVTHKDRGDAHMALIKSCLLHINPVPAVGMWLSWPFLPLASLHTRAAPLAADTSECF